MWTNQVATETLVIYKGKVEFCVYDAAKLGCDAASLTVSYTVIHLLPPSVWGNLFKLLKSKRVPCADPESFVRGVLL